MRNPERIDIILNYIKTIWKKCPDQRFCQLMTNIGLDWREDHFYLEDDKLEIILKKILEKM